MSQQNLDAQEKKNTSSTSTDGIQKYEFVVVLENYLDSISSLMELTPLIMELVSTKLKQEAKHLDDFVQKNKVEVIEGNEENDEGNTFAIMPEKIVDFRYLTDQINASFFAYNFLPSNFIVAFVSQYDSYLSNLIRVIFEVKPEILNSSEKKINFSELIAFNSIEEAKDFVAEKEIETIMRESHLEQFKWLERKLNMELRKLPSFKEFIEITERRNLFVHTNGIVSRQYINVCKENGVEGIEEIKVGKKLKVTGKYLIRCYEVMFEIGAKLQQVIWRKLIPNKLEEADDNLIDITYNLLINRQYSLAINLLTFATDSLKSHYSNETKYTFIINKALAYYLKDDKDNCAKTLNHDWSVANDKFKLAVSILKEEYKSASKIMISIGNKNEHLTKDQYREWPLFLKFRESEIFKKTYKEIFNEDFIYIQHKPKKKLTDIFQYIKAKESANENAEEEKKQHD